jgi:hypothetical protein
MAWTNNLMEANTNGMRDIIINNDTVVIKAGGYNQCRLSGSV